MDKKPMQNSGAKLLLKKYRDTFRIPENINHYSEEDFQRAEKKYLKYCLTNGSSEKSRELISGNRE